MYRLHRLDWFAVKPFVPDSTNTFVPDDDCFSTEDIVYKPCGSYGAFWVPHRRWLYWLKRKESFLEDWHGWHSPPHSFWSPRVWLKTQSDRKALWQIPSWADTNGDAQNDWWECIPFVFATMSFAGQNHDFSWAKDKKLKKNLMFFLLKSCWKVTRYVLSTYWHNSKQCCWDSNAQCLWLLGNTCPNNFCILGHVARRIPQKLGYRETLFLSETKGLFIIVQLHTKKFSHLRPSSFMKNFC